MPKRNAIKQYAPNSYYHIYTRANNKISIFNSKTTTIFLNIAKLLLSSEQQSDKFGRPYPNFHSQIELLAYAIMPNHFHLLVFQKNELDMEKLMRSLMTRFSITYNKTHNHTGRVFESRYLAKRIETDAQLYHISRYIHLNPTDWQSGRNTSLNYYSGKYHANWINPRKILQLFPSYTAYLKFLKSYNNHDSPVIE